MLRAVRARADVELPTSDQALVDLLKLAPQTVLLTEPAILRMQRPRAALLEWTRAGGNAVICGLFSIESEYAEQAAMFEDWDLDWKGGSYHRTDFVLAPAFASTAGIPAAYNVKASHIVVPPHARIYVPAPGARTQSNVFDPMSVDQTEAAVARDRCIDSTVSWVGDVNGEEETTPIILWLAGLTLAALLTDFATATIRWSPTARAHEEAPELTVRRGAVRLESAARRA